jgi:hypothetical protein
MNWTVAVTFESPETQAPQTVRVSVEAGSPSTAASRAIREARKALPKRRWEYLSILMERAA